MYKNYSIDNEILNIVIQNVDTYSTDNEILEVMKSVGKYSIHNDILN